MIALDTEDSLNLHFAELTGWLFDWNDCVTLVDEDSEIQAEDISIEEAIRLIEEDGYTPIPF